MVAWAIDNSAMPSAARPRRPRAFYHGARYVPGDSVGFLMHQAVQAMRRHIDQRMAALGLTAAQWHPLWRIRLEGTVGARELAQSTGVDPGAMTRLVDRLVAKGLVERVRGRGDRRTVELTLTAAGRAVADKVPAELAAVNNAFLRDFDEAEWLQLRGLLRRMLDNGETLGAGR
jgi:DNA-binding MarR family transcriptional regulator